MAPVTARVAIARAAILVLIYMGNSVRLGVAVVVRMPFGRGQIESGSNPRAKRRVDRLFVRQDSYLRGPLGPEASPFTSKLSISVSNSQNARAP